jgi:hypothetical protein
VGRFCFIKGDQNMKDRTNDIIEQIRAIDEHIRAIKQMRAQLYTLLTAARHASTPVKPHTTRH